MIFYFFGSDSFFKLFFLPGKRNRKDQKRISARNFCTAIAVKALPQRGGISSSPCHLHYCRSYVGFPALERLWNFFKSYFSHDVKCLQGLMQPPCEARVRAALPDRRARRWEAGQEATKERFWEAAHPPAPPALQYLHIVASTAAPDRSSLSLAADTPSPISCKGSLRFFSKDRAKERVPCE